MLSYKEALKQIQNSFKDKYYEYNNELTRVCIQIRTREYLIAELDTQIKADKYGEEYRLKKVIMRNRCIEELKELDIRANKLNEEIEYLGALRKKIYDVIVEDFGEEVANR